MSTASTKPEKKQAVIVDAAVVEAVAATMKAKEAADKEAAFLADLAERGLLTEPAKFRYLGQAQELGRAFARWKTTFSRVLPPRTTDQDFLTMGAVLALNVGDADPVAAYPKFYARLDAEEAAEAVTVQDALALREAERPATNAREVHEAAVAELTKRQSACAEANRAREAAEGCVTVAVRNHDAERDRLQKFVAGLGEGGEAKARALLASLAKPEPVYEAPRAHVPPPPVRSTEADSRRVQNVVSVGGV